MHPIAEGERHSSSTSGSGDVGMEEDCGGSFSASQAKRTRWQPERAWLGLGLG